MAAPPENDAIPLSTSPSSLARCQVVAAGAGSADITAFVPDIGMMGYALKTHRTEGIGVPLKARAIVFRDSTDALTAVVCCDLWGITPAVRAGVLDRLERRNISLDASRLLLTGTHTHSGPGGYSHHLLFNLSIPGFVPEVFEGIVEGIADAIQHGTERLKPSALRIGVGSFPEDAKVAFNRSLRAYNRNPEVHPLTQSTAHLGVDRSMTSLFIASADESNAPIASFHWFGVHGCSLHSDAGQIHPDNKGMAALHMEAYAKDEWDAPGYVAAFPQTTAGDVSPNFRWNKERRLQEGDGENDRESAALNGRLQAERAIANHSSTAPTGLEHGALLQFVDFRDAEAAPTYANGCMLARTGPAVLGVRMMSGTADGSGPPPAWALRPLWWVLNRANGLLKACKRGLRRCFKLPERADIHGPKVPFMEVGLGKRGRLFGLLPQGNPPLPQSIDPGLRRIKHLHHVGAQGEGGWVPQILPIQLVRLGALLIVGLPFEPTTIAGQRLREQVARRMNDHGVERVVIAGWANAYGGYLTTFEEYQAQQYEGASTYFGQWTLAATQTAVDDLIDAYLAGKRGLLDGPTPEQIPPEELSLRSYSPRP